VPPQNCDAVKRLNELTGGKGPERCIDAIGMESHVTISQPDTILDPLSRW
jgi:hypothetical protein